MIRSAYRYGCPLASSLVFALLASGQQRIIGGPPPEIKNHIDALIKAVNSGSAENWESMAQQHFSPGELKRHTAASRKQTFDQLHRELGTISPGRVEGPDEPLRLHLKGSTGASGIIELKLEPEAPYRIDHMKVKIGGGDHDESQSTVGSPAINGQMSNDQITAALDAYFDKLSASDLFSGNVLVAKDGAPIYSKSYGFADRYPPALSYPRDSLADGQGKQRPPLRIPSA